MTDKQKVWQPDKSRALDSKEQEKGRGSYKQSSNKPPLKKRERKIRVAPVDSGYSTIERGGRCSLLDYTAPLTNGDQGLSCSDFSRWQDKELAPLSITRRPMPGVRNTMLSRLETRSSRRQRDAGVCEYQHLMDPCEHMEHYRTHCYTTLTCSSQEITPTRTELVNQGQQSLLKLEVKSLYRGDGFLRELASRLGVESIQEPQLLRHTPPSIVKKPRNKADLAIDLIPKPTSDEGEDDLCTPGTAWMVDNTKTPPTHRPLELPKISEVVSISHKTTSSTISINKYLRVNSRGDEDSKPTASLSSASDLTTEVTTDVTESTPNQQTPVHHQDKPLEKQLQDKPKVHTIDKAHKERLISSTAQSLGLSSRQWTTPPSNRQLSRYLNYSSRPATRERGLDGTRRLDSRQSRPSTKQESNRRRDNKRMSTRPSTRQEACLPLTQEHKLQQSSVKLKQSQSTRHKQKLDQLKSIYSQHSSTPSRPHTRPPSRLHTRPPTRAKEVVKLDTLDGSSYWNELRVESLNREEVSKNETKNDGFSSVQLLSQQSKSLSGKMLKNRTKHFLQMTGDKLTAGSSPVKITRHLSRLKRKFDRVLNIHKHEVVS